MGRIFEDIEVRGQWCHTLFDTGAKNSYVTRTVADLLGTFEAQKPLRTALGGSTRELKEATVLHASIEGNFISTHAFVVDEIGKDDEGRPIDVLLGALAMQQWSIRPIPDEEKLDFSHYSAEFVEF